MSKPTEMGRPIHTDDRTNVVFSIYSERTAAFDDLLP